MKRDTSQAKPRVVIVGAGFGGLTAAKALGKAPVDLIVIDQHNYHLFQPLLYQVATAGLSPSDVASPIRQILRGQVNTKVILAKVSAIDLTSKEVIAEGRRVQFDKLLLATGARHAYFGHDEWEKYAPGLKHIDDATYLRRRILLAFENAEVQTDAVERRRLLSFVIVGAGPTGVEMAGAIAELAGKALAANFRAIDPSTARIILVEAGPRVLPALDPSLSTVAMRALQKLGAEVKLRAAVTVCDADGVIAGGQRIEARTVIWAAGVMASPVGTWLDAKVDRSGRVIVNADLTVPGHPDVFVFGDVAAFDDANGGLLPGVAPVAKQQGAYVANRITAELKGQSTPPFCYRDHGSLATIGRKNAVVQIGGLRLSGFTAWLIWCAAHIYFLIGFRNRLAVSLNWAWNYLTFQRGARLITGQTSLKIGDISALSEPAPRQVIVGVRSEARSFALADSSSVSRQ
jgi:NADH dehydrogenase